MKKVLVWETLGTVSGGQKMTLTIMDMLKDGYEFCCLIPAEGMLSSELERHNIPFVLMGDQTLPTGVKGKQVIFRYGWMSVKSICKSLRAIWKYKPDILYCPGPAALPWSAICGMLMRKPVIWHLHHIFLDGTTKKLLNLCSCFGSVKKIIAVSQCVGDQISTPKGKEKVEVIYNPVDVDKYASGDAEKVRAEIEQKLGRTIVRGGVIILIQIATITKNKRQELFIEVIGAIKNAGREVIGILLGDAVTDADVKYKAGLMQRIKDLKLMNDVYMPGFRNDVEHFLSLSDCLVIPSEEGLPLAGMEAMSARCSVIANAYGGAMELLEKAECGGTYPSTASIQDIASIVIDAIDHKDQKALERGYRFCQKQTHHEFRKKMLKVF